MSAGDWKEMYKAAIEGDFELLKYHLGNGVDPNYQHPEILCTPLVGSIIAGHTEIAIHLLGHGADPKLRSEYDNMTPLQAAKKYQRTEVLKTLRSSFKIS